MIISLANFNFDLLGRAIFAIVLFALNVGIIFIIASVAKSVLNRFKRKGKPVKEVRLPDSDDFFFGSVSDWSELK